MVSAEGEQLGIMPTAQALEKRGVLVEKARATGAAAFVFASVPPPMLGRPTAAFDVWFLSVSRPPAVNGFIAIMPGAKFFSRSI